MEKVPVLLPNTGQVNIMRLNISLDMVGKWNLKKIFYLIREQQKI